MKQTLIITNEQIRNRAALIVSSIPIDETHEVTIKPRKIDRSAEQNRYYWSIITIISAELGMTKDEMHEVYKDMFLVPIFTRDDEGYASMISALADVPELKKEVVKLTSTTKASVRQMGEYLDDVQHHASSLGIRLPFLER